MTPASLDSQNKYGTDKIQSGYSDAYQFQFSRFLNQSIVLWEIGVCTGGSLNLWKDYFHAWSVIVGIDVRDPTGPLASGVRFFNGDATDPETVNKVLENSGPPDIVIDDGSHLSSHMHKSFGLIWPLVRKGGVYLVEDLGTQYPHRHRMDYLDGAPFTETVVQHAHSLMSHQETSVVRIGIEYGQVYFHKR